MRPIDADEVVKHLYWDNDIEAWYLRGKDLDDFPTINPEDLRLKGKWIDISGALDRGEMLLCSYCHQRADYFIGGSEDWWADDRPKYCPNCGAKMEE